MTAPRTDLSNSKSTNSSTTELPISSNIFFRAASPFASARGSPSPPRIAISGFPGNSDVAYEDRLLLNLTLSASRGAWRPVLRTRVEGRIPENRPASARLRLRPGIEYTLPLGVTRPPVLVVNNEFFLVPGTNSFFSRDSYTQNRFQAGVRVPMTPSFSIRPYCMLVSVNVPAGWDTNQVVGISIAVRVRNTNP